MFERLSAAGQVLAFRLSGKVTGEDITRYKDLLKDMLALHGRLGVCVDFTGLSDMSADAIIEGTRTDLEFLSDIGRFTRLALVSDKEWPHAMVTLIGALLGSFQMKVFVPDRRDEALRWAAALPAAPKSEASAFRFITTAADNILALEIGGVLSSEAMSHVIREFEMRLQHHEKVGLLYRMMYHAGMHPAVFMQTAQLWMKLAATRKVNRYAIVGAPDWLGNLIASVRPELPAIDIQTFPPELEAEAWAWLGAEPAT